MNAKKRVLVVHNQYQIPGGEDTVMKNEVKLIQETFGEVESYIKHNASMNDLSLAEKILLPINTIFNYSVYRDIRRIIKEKKIDVVHVHNTLNMISPAVYYAAVSMNVPVVQTMHNFRMLCPGATFFRDSNICKDCVEKGLHCAVKHRCYRGSLLQTLACVISTYFHRWTGIYSKINFICLTEFNKKQLLLLNRKREVVNPNKIYVKPNFTYSGVRHVSSDYYLFIGRIEEIKGIEILVKAFTNMPDLNLKIAGTGNELEKYKTLAKDYKNIEFLGFLNRDQLNETMSKAKAVIVASQWYETFGMIIAEAYANQIPVITGDIGNIGTLVIDGETGLKFTYNSYSSLIETIKKFETIDTSSWGMNAYRKYSEEFSPEINSKRLEEIYDSLLHKGDYR